MSRNVLILICVLILPLFVLNATDWYIDNTAQGNNNGTSWDHAWNDFEDIVWKAIKPGDILFLSGGNKNKSYNDRLFIKNVHGTEKKPIIITVGREPGHNGKVFITNNGRLGGIVIASSTYISIDGNVDGKQNIIVQKCSVSGIHIIDGNSHHINLTYLEIAYNGNESNEHGLHIKYNGEIYPIVEVSYCKIHHNWSSQIQAFGSRHIATQFGGIIIHDNEIYGITSDGFESGAGGIDFYNNSMHTKSDEGAEGHTDGLQFYGEYYRIYNNRFFNFAHPTESSTAYINIGTRTSMNSQISEEIYIYNNLLYEEKEYPYDNSLRGITYVPVVKKTSAIRNVVIANNTIIGMPTHGISAHFGILPPSKINNIVIANNIIYNCYTNGGGQGINLTHRYGTIFHSAIDFQKTANTQDILFDYNIIHPGKKGSGLIGFCGNIIGSEKLNKKFKVNSHGGNVHPFLDEHYIPKQKMNPCVDRGLDLSDYFTIDLKGIRRPSGLKWDIGAFEFVQDSSHPDINNGAAK